MLNEKLRVALVVWLVTASGLASAARFDDTRFYIGGEASVYNKTSYNKGNTPDLNNFKTSNAASELVITQNKPGINIFVGGRFNEYIGGELGFGLIATVRGTAQLNREATNKINNIFLDMLAYMPVATNADLIGSIGVGAIQSHSNVQGATFQDKSALDKAKTGYRLGGGAQYYMTNNWSTRVMVRYQQGSQTFLRSNISISLGLIYIFNI